MNQRQLLIFLPILGVLTFVLYGVGAVARENSRSYSCQSNLKKISQGLSQYVRDYDEKNPLANNWKTVLQPYVKTNEIFDCPSATSYAFNRYLSGVADARVLNRAETPAFFDSSSTLPNASDFGTSWPKDGAHSIWNRGRGTNVVFYDFHVEWRQQKPAFLPIPKPLPPIYRFDPNLKIPMPTPPPRAAPTR
ncbi:MAG: hypothetical protein KY445_10410 [Armatimonadetes bacterium]|nr:hypothetical protein [Armatimonadota bacterium]